MYEILGLKRLNINNMEMWVGEDSMEKHIKNYIIKESFYSNEIIFRKEIYNEETKEEISQYFSKIGEFIVEIKNNRKIYLEK
ncbi:hypothetical protein FUAG_00949 [Fusobacterium ulcerans ATCC 49185]|uniref:RRM domain-containing protein n=2 Tax=Fusobacterium ulcerans TaxID=861 RepID=A0AAX2J7G2_9FUSO|nr:hypothetical protein FUAG_00949 [Fusobacterium ulcerans ATCC 49185]SQI99397.1 Uncharacterised protein [Fusobacterium ulcerans]